MEMKNIPVYGKGENIRDWLFVDDHIDAIWQILQFGKRGQTYDIGGEELSNIDLIRFVIKKYAEAVKKSKEEFFSLISFVTDRPGHDFRYAIDVSKIKNELKWSPRISISEGLERTINFYVKNYFTCHMENN